MRFVLLSLIGFYQNYISPRKRFRCAYGVVHKNGTCSSKVKTIISNSNGFDWYPQVLAQFKACKRANLMIQEERKKDDKKNDSHKWCFVADCGMTGCLGFLGWFA